MKVLFLDFDGVLNNEEFWRQPETNKSLLPHQDKLDPQNIAVFNEILAAAPGIKVVVSSTWRKYFDLTELRRILLLNGVRDDIDIIGGTPIKFSLVSRGGEIRMWLRNHAEKVRDEGAEPVEAYVALDDDTAGMEYLGGHHVLTIWDDAGGLRKEHVELAAKALQLPPTLAEDLDGEESPAND